jgi:hypothetical protein
MHVLFAAVLLLSVIVAAPVRAAALTGEWVNLEQPLEEDLYAAGREVRIGARIAGDVTAAGMSVRIEAIVEDDVIAAAEHVSIESPVVDDVRAAGRRVDITADVGDHLVAAGDTVHIADGVSIGSFAWLAGREVYVGGRIGQELRVAAQSLVIGGEVAGDVEVMAEHIRLLPGARIKGNLVWRSPESPTVDDEAVIGGRTVERPWPEHRPDRASVVFGLIFMGVALLVTGAVLFLVFPRCFTAAARGTRTTPGKTLAIGLALLAATPLVGVLLFITGVGWLLGVLVFMSWLLALVVAWFVAAFTLGSLVLPRALQREDARGWPRWVALLGGILILALLQLIPFLGGFIAFFALLVGLGGLALSCYRSDRPGSVS